MLGTFSFDFSNVITTGEFGYLHYEAETQMEMILDYLKMNESALSEDSNKFKDYYDKIQKDANDEVWEENYFEHKEAIENHSYYFPNLFYTSMFVMISSFFEEYMNNILKTTAKEFGQKEKIPKKFSEGNKEITRTKDYILSFTKIDFSIMEEKWKKLESFLSYRNFIVHRNSNINNYNDETKRFNVEASIKLSSDFVILTDGKVILKNSNYIKEFCNLVCEVGHFILLKSEKELANRKKNLDLL